VVVPGKRKVHNGTSLQDEGAPPLVYVRFFRQPASPCDFKLSKFYRSMETLGIMWQPHPSFLISEPDRDPESAFTICTFAPRCRSRCHTVHRKKPKPSPHLSCSRRDSSTDRTAMCQVRNGALPDTHRRVRTFCTN
jgi:hypothetical protein